LTLYVEVTITATGGTFKLQSSWQVCPLRPMIYTL